MGGEEVNTPSRDEIQEEERSISDLPSDILSLIKSNLCAADFVAFSSVCKTWKSLPFKRQLPPPNDTSLSNCPCLIYLDNHFFFHPLYNHSFRLHTHPGFPDGRIRVSKYGWLLMTRGDICSFFFHPFTNTTIHLPPNTHSYTAVTFTNPPTSDECQVVTFGRFDGYILVNTIKRGEESWTEHEFRNHPGFEISRCNPVSCNGLYCYLGLEGNLVIYDPRKITLRWTGSPKHLWSHVTSADCRHFLVESDGGDIWAVFIACNGSRVGIFRLNLGNMVWEAVDDLQDKMLFVSRPGSFLEKARVRGTGNKVYLPRFYGAKGMFYSLATKRYHTYESGSSYKTFHNSKERLHCTWIKPLPLANLQQCGEEILW